MNDRAALFANVLNQPADNTTRLVLADWHEDEEKEQARKYKALHSLFEKEVTEPKVFRVGKEKASYYLVGKSRSGNWVGAKTEAAET